MEEEREEGMTESLDLLEAETLGASGNGPDNQDGGKDSMVDGVHQETLWLLFSLLFAFLKLFFFASLFPLIQTYYFSQLFLTYRLFSACVYQMTNDSVVTKELGVGR